MNLERYQGSIILVLVVVTFSVLVLVAIDQYSLNQRVLLLIPSLLRLYFAEYLVDFILSGGCFVLGLLIFLELPGWKSGPRRWQLVIGISLIAFPLSILLHFSIPVTGILGEPKLQDGVVLQTTNYTCAPASIATLARFTKKHPNLSEREATKLTHTNRFGTSTLAQIRAMRQLGFKTQYKSGMSLDELAQIQQIALLHVNELIGKRKIAHTVVFLSIDSQQHRVTIANPLSGIQIKTYQDMEGYWRLGEAVVAL